MNVEILNPMDYPDWDSIFLTNDQSTIFHTSAWAKVLSETYKYKPYYFTTVKDGKLFSLMPAMEINSAITGRRGVSLPFSDYCDPIVSNNSDIKENLECIIRFRKNALWN